MITLSNDEFKKICLHHRNRGFWEGFFIATAAIVLGGLGGWVVSFFI